MNVQRLSILFSAIIALCAKNLFSAAKVKEAAAPIMHTIGEFKREKIYPKSKESQKSFLRSLHGGLNSQSNAVAINMIDQLFAIDINNRAISYSSAYEESKCSKIDFEKALHENPEFMAFMLRYGADPSLLRPDEFDPHLYIKMKHIVADWQHCDDEYTREYIDLSNRYWDLLYLSCFRAHMTCKAHMQQKTVIGYFGQNPQFWEFCRHEKSPLKFLVRLTALKQAYLHMQCEQESAGIINTGIMSELDEDYFNLTDQVMAEYEMAIPYIDTLYTSIEREVISTSMNFIDKLPAIRAEQKPKPAPKTKKKKSSRPLTVAPATYQAAEPSSSTDTAQSVMPEISVPLEYQKNVTPELLLRNASVPMVVRKAFESVAHPDGSFTIAEDATRIELFDAPNQQKIKLFKVEKPQQLYLNPEYTEWVQKWFDAPDEALAQQGYNDTTSDRFKYRATARQIHGFTRLVDRFLPQCSTRSTTPNKKHGRVDTLITIPGMLGGKFGLFLFIIASSNGKWYHRNFEPREGRALLDEYRQKGFYDVEFPELR